MQNNNWTSAWPTEQGNYWFHGWLHSKSYGSKPETFFVEAYLFRNNSIMYASEGAFFYANDGEKGLWLPAEVPEPSELNLEELQ